MCHVKSKNSQPSLLYLLKIIQNLRQNKDFILKTKAEIPTDRRFALQEMFKEVLQSEGKWHQMEI